MIDCEHGNNFISSSILVVRLILAARFHSPLKTMPPFEAAFSFLHLLFRLANLN